MNRAEERRTVRMLRAIDRYRQDVALERQLLDLAREQGRPLPQAERIAGATALGDPVKLRGIPAVGRFGIGGAISGTRPDQLR